MANHETNFRQMGKTVIMMVLMAAVSLTAAARQKTTRGKLTLNEDKPRTETTHTDTDTVRTSTATDSVRITGYEKAQSSAYESFFVVNNSADYLSSINITITYLDMKGRQLHKRTETVACKLASGDTKNLSIRSWDKQKVWYYNLTQSRHNDYATPYDVEVRVNYYVRPKAQ